MMTYTPNDDSPEVPEVVVGPPDSDEPEPEPTPPPDPVIGPPDEPDAEPESEPEPVADESEAG
jgi:hypothetical protein